jgi:hypothetical protein
MFTSPKLMLPVQTAWLIPHLRAVVVRSPHLPCRHVHGGHSADLRISIAAAAPEAVMLSDRSPDGARPDRVEDPLDDQPAVLVDACSGLTQL